MSHRWLEQCLRQWARLPETPFAERSGMQEDVLAAAAAAEAAAAAAAAEAAAASGAEAPVADDAVTEAYGAGFRAGHREGHLAARQHPVDTDHLVCYVCLDVPRVGPGRCCHPRQPTHSQPSFLDLNGVL